MCHQVCPHFLFDLLPAVPSFVPSALFYWPPPAHQIHHMQCSSKAFTLVISFCPDICVVHFELHAFGVPVLINFRFLPIYCLLLLLPLTLCMLIT